MNTTKETEKRLAIMFKETTMLKIVGNENGYEYKIVDGNGKKAYESKSSPPIDMFLEHLKQQGWRLVFYNGKVENTK